MSSHDSNGTFGGAGPEDCEALLRARNPSPKPTKRFGTSCCRAAAAIASVVVVALLWVSHHVARLQVSDVFARISEAEMIAAGESGQPGVYTDKQAFELLDSDNDGFVTETSLDGTPTKVVDYNNFKSDLDADRETAQEQNGDSEEYLEATYWRHMAGAGFADKEQVEAGEAVLEVVYRPMPDGRMVVHELYTYGAPATTLAGVFNAQAQSGCLPGLRIVTQEPFWMAAEQTILFASDPVPSLLDFAFKHGLMEFMPASTINVKADPIRDCQYYKDHPHRLKDSPKWDNMWWINGHMVYPGVMAAHLDKYPASPFREISASDLALLGGATVARRLQSKAYTDMSLEDKVERGTIMARLAFATYGPPAQAGLVKEHMGWVLVGHSNAATDSGGASGLLGYNAADGAGTGVTSVLQTVNSFSDGFGDHMMLFQHPDTLECALVFEGSGLDDLKDWLANMNFWTTEFCGFGQTHRGFRAKLLRMVGGIDFVQSIRRKIGSCSKLSVAGHSLGGAQAELFTACANYPREHGEVGFLEHRLLRMPTADEPKKLRHFFADHVQGTYLKNKGNGLCMDVQGTMATRYRTPVIMYECELPGSDFAKDQTWRFTDDGFIVSELSGMCIDGNDTVADKPVSQWPCEFGQADSDQRWDHTPEGFLRNRKSGKCIDDKMKLFECPFTDQVWHLTEESLLVNKLSGLCMNVEASDDGLAPGEGSSLYLGECERGSPGTWHQWEFVGDQLRNKFNGLCVVEKILWGAVHFPEAILGDCKEDPTKMYSKYVDKWQFTDMGFIKNKYSDRCIDVLGTPGKESGTHLSVTKCEDKGISTTGLWVQDPRGFIINTGSNIKSQSKCMEIFADPWNNTQLRTAGQELWLDFCKLNSDQKWVVRGDGKIKSVIGGEKCLSIMHDITLTTATSATLFWIDNCAEIDDPVLYQTFKWELQPGGHFTNKFSHRCMTYLTHNEPDHAVMAGLGADEFEVVVRWCGEAPHGVEWRHLEDGSFQNTETGKCLDTGFTDVRGEAPVILRPCDQTRPTQRWKLIDLGILLNVELGKCVEQRFDPASLAKVSGQSVYEQDLQVLVVPCPADKEMLWKQLPTGQIQNKASGKCLDAPQPGQKYADGSALPPHMLTESECDSTRATQQWEPIEAPMVSISE